MISILLADEDKDFCQVVEDCLLQILPAQILTVNNGEAALTLMLARNFDLVVIGSRLGEMTGQELFVDWKAIGQAGFFVLCSDDTSTELEGFGEPGFLGVLRKSELRSACAPASVALALAKLYFPNDKIG